MSSKQDNKSIFKTSIITGGSQLIVALFKMVRAKALALILGAAGTGLIGLYMSITGLVNSISAFGLPSSAVREIAKSNSKENKTEIGETLFVFRILIFLTSFIGFLFILIFAKQLGHYTFKDYLHTREIQWLSFLVLATGLSTGQNALLQGLRKIKELALAKIIGVVIGTAICVTLIFIFKEDGIIPFILFGGFTTAFVSWTFARRVNIKQIKVEFSRFKAISKKLFAMGLAFLVGGLAISFSAFYSRIIITDSFSLVELGFYTASWTLSAVYVQFVLSAMGADFYPNLVSKIEDKKVSTQLVNTQLLVGIVLSITGIIAVIGFSGLILSMFYSKEFIEASVLLQWMTFGMALKVIIWPLGFIIAAKGKSKLFIINEIVWVILFLGLMHPMIHFFGLEGVAIAFFITYAIYGLIIFVSAKRLIQFKFTLQAKKTISFFILCISLVFLSQRFLPTAISTTITIIMIILTMIWSNHMIKTLLGKSAVNIFKNKLSSIFRNGKK